MNKDDQRFMANKPFWSDWLFPIISMIIFALLLGAMLFQMDGITVTQLISYSSGLLAYSMMLVVTFMGSRPRYFEYKFGMPPMYVNHAVMGVVLTILILIHIVIQWNGFSNFVDGTMSNVSLTGWIAIFALLLIMGSGIFSISQIFTKHSQFMTKIKSKLNREMNLWFHRFAIVMIIAVYVHLFLLPFLRENVLFMILLSVFTLISLGYYFYWKIQVASLPEYRVKSVYRGTPSIWVVEFEPVKGHITDYAPGDYFFIRIKNNDKITKEGHPFSTSSAITSRYNNSIEFMIKDAGDWTRSLEHLRVGDIATLEGPYGDFMYPELDQSDEDDITYVLMAGGIGLTPCLAVLRHEIEKGSQRRIELFWGIAFEEDLFNLEEFEEAKKINPNFNYHITFDQDHVDGYAHGYITDEFIRERAGAEVYTDGHFFVCGPGPMLDASQRIFDENRVHWSQISLDDFGF